VICQKEYTLEVAPVSCPDWTDLNWDVAAVYGGTSTLIAAGSTATLHLAGTPFPDKFAQLHGSFNYSGPLCNCRITSSLVTAGFVGPVGEIGGRVQIEILQDSVPIIRLSNPFIPGSGYTYMPYGDSTFDFSVEAAVNSTIEVQGTTSSTFIGPSGPAVFSQVIGWAFSGIADEVDYTFSIISL
jgi:hypothetical protein